MVLLKRNPVSEKKLFSSDPKGRLVMHLAFNCSKTIRLVEIYAPNVAQSEYFRELEKFVGMSHLLVLFDLNVL